jgi:chemotaxis protein methyltransferase CheR
VDSITDIELPLLLEAIYAKYQYDFRHYAMASLKRRLGQALPRFGVHSLSGLQERILREPEAFHELLSYLTVQVSEMFRDPGFFRALREQVLPVLATYPSLKIWVPGCSAGEEVYSLAILLREEGLLARTIIYATDINAAALEAAKRGIYPQDRIAAYSKAYQAAGGKGSLSDYYTIAYDSAKFDETLTHDVLFSDHSLATDHVFAEVQLVSCRNVLIYFDRELQDRAVGLFSESLERSGFLGLGSKETLRFAAHASAFSEFVPEHRIYRKR